VLQGFRGAIDTILSTVFTVAVGGPGGWFKDNLPNHAAAARAIESGNPEKARAAMERLLGYTRLKLSNRKTVIAAATRRAGGSDVRVTRTSPLKPKRRRHDP
jgi:GntR family galactonate operon transcriptional repressor